MHERPVLKGRCIDLFLFGLYLRPCSTHAGYIGTDRSLLMGHNALLLRQIARDLLPALSHRHDDMAWPLLDQSVALEGSRLEDQDCCGRKAPFIA